MNLQREERNSCSQDINTVNQPYSTNAGVTLMILVKQTDGFSRKLLNIIL